MSKGKVAIALLGGSALGTALGILFAPEAGTGTREKLSAYIAGLGDTVKDVVSDQHDKLDGECLAEELTMM